MPRTSSSRHAWTSWHDTRVLILDADLRSATALARIARAAAGEISLAQSLDAPSADAQDYDLLMVNYDSFGASVTESILQRFGALKDRGRVLFCCQHVRREDLAHFFEAQRVGNFMAHNDDFDTEELLVTIQKIVRQDIWGIDKYFSWAAQSFDIRFRSSEEIRDVLAQAGAMIAKVQLPGRLCDMFLSVVDELATNAVYNAPRDTASRARFASHDRKHVVNLDAREEVVARFRFDGRRLGVSMTDQCGSLTSSEILSYLGRCFKRSHDQVEWKAGGAGIGLYQAFESLSHLIVNIRPHTCTEVIGIIDVRGGYRNFASRTKSFNIFVASDPVTAAVR